MLTAEEKIAHFSQLVYQQSQKQYDAILEQARSEVQDKLEAYENRCLEKAYQSIQKQMTLIQKQSNESVSRLQLESKKELLKKRESMVEDVFGEVLKKIMDFKKTDAYLGYLCLAVEDAAKALENGTLTVSLDYSDKELLPRIQAKFPGYTVEILKDSDDIIGGVRVTDIASSRIVDNSIASKLNEQKEKFLNTSGLYIS